MLSGYQAVLFICNALNVCTENLERFIGAAPLSKLVDKVFSKASYLREIAVVGYLSSGNSPNSLDWIELWRI
jgi:hypothetical protein